MEENKGGEMSKMSEGNKKKVGRKPKNEKRLYELDRSQQKFFVDLSKEKENLEMVFNQLEKTNAKEFGREVLFKDLALYALSKLTDKDYLKIQELTLTKEEILDRVVRDYNLKHGTNLSRVDYCLMKEGIKV